MLLLGSWRDRGRLVTRQCHSTISGCVTVIVECWPSSSAVVRSKLLTHSTKPESHSYFLGFVLFCFLRQGLTSFGFSAALPPQPWESWDPRHEGSSGSHSHLLLDGRSLASMTFKFPCLRASSAASPGLGLEHV